jgi:carbonic anhydrase/acetyltransferase-like protein (isoleucine patch superfamily)
MFAMAIYALGNGVPDLPKDDAFWVAPTASVIGNVRLARNASVWFGAVLRADNDPLLIGENTNIQDGSVLHTDTGVPFSIGANVTVGHSVTLHGVTIGEGSLIGMGATLLNRVRIGKCCLVGAHALIPEGKEFPDYSLILGAPARLARTLSEEEGNMLALVAAHYVENWQRYKRDLRVVG